MDQHIFIASVDDADWFHDRLAGAAAIARSGVIDMFRVQAVGAVIALASTHDRCPDELLAMSTLERLIGIVAGFPELFSRVSRAGSLSVSGGTLAMSALFIFEVEIVVVVSVIHVILPGRIGVT